MHVAEKQDIFLSVWLEINFQLLPMIQFKINAVAGEICSIPPRIFSILIVLMQEPQNLSQLGSKEPQILDRRVLSHSQPPG